MATYQEAMEALRRADAAGDADSARRLAQIANSLRQQGAGPPPSQPQQSGFMANLNTGIAESIGAPVDLVNMGLGAVGVPVSDAPLGGSQSIRRGMGALGVGTTGEAPDSTGSALARGIGGAAGFLLPGSAAVGAVRQGAGVAGRVADDIARQFIRTPRTAIASELGAGGGAAAARDAADRSGLGGAQGVAAELAGGVAGGLTPYGARAAFTNSPISNFLRTQTAPLTRGGAEELARQRMLGLAEDPQAAISAMSQPNEFGLSPATQTGDRRLMALERTVRDTDAPTQMAMREAEETALAAMREAVAQPAQGRGAPQAQSFISERLSGLTDRMNARVADAAANAERRLDAIAPQRRSSENSIVVREELENAYRWAQREQTRLWEDAIPQAAPVSTANARQAYEQLLTNTAEPLRRQMPREAIDYLDQGRNTRFGETESARDVLGLRSALLEDSRVARARGEYNKARMSDTIADAILRDLEMSPTVVGPAAEARAFTETLNRKFRQGAIGRVLGYSEDGSASMAPERTLESIVGPGTRGAVGVDHLRGALGPEAQASEGALGDFLRNRFAFGATRQGQVSPTLGDTFLRGNQEVLDRVPALREQFQGAIDAQRGARQTEQAMGARERAITDPRESIAAALTEAPAARALGAVTSAPDPAAAANQIWRQAGRDPTGEARLGLKGMLLDDVLARAASGRAESGERVLTGTGIQDALARPGYREAAEAFLTASERSRLDRIARELTLVERARGNLPSVGDSVVPRPSGNILAFVAGTLGARAGAQLGAGTSGASLRTASTTSRMFQGLVDRMTVGHADRLIRQAITGDRRLFEDLLTPVAQMTPGQERRMATVLAGIVGAQETALPTQGAPAAEEGLSSAGLLGGGQSASIGGLLSGPQPVDQPWFLR